MENQAFQTLSNYDYAHKHTSAGQTASDVLLGTNHQQANNEYNNLMEALKWNEYMSNTAVQRRAQDLKAAGINPIIAGGAGGSASTPTTTGAKTVFNGYSDAINNVLGIVNNIVDTAKNVSGGKQFEQIVSGILG